MGTRGSVRNMFVVGFVLVSIMVMLACQAVQPMPTAEDAMPEATEPAPVAAGIVPEPIPAGFDFPTDRNALQKLVDANDVPAMRHHGWNLWAGMTSDSNSSLRGATLPVWETWLATAATFNGPPANEAEIAQAPKREFVQPAQFAHNTVPDSQAEMMVVGFNKFNPAMVDYVWSPHQSPNLPGRELLYYSQQSLTALNDAWPASTAIADRKVQDAPQYAMELKPVFMWVSATKPTALPFWQGPSASTDPNCAPGVLGSIDDLKDPTGKPVPPCQPTSNTWTHCTILDPDAAGTPLSPATEEQFAAADLSQATSCTVENALYGSLDLIYHFELDETEAGAMSALQPFAGNVAAGDYGVLVAIHVNTKEIEEWTWQTYWWQGGTSPPDNFPGDLANMTDNVQGPWRNYAMCTAYSQTTAPGNQGQMNVCFNPYLEPSLPDGIRSNCVTCHSMARFPNPGEASPEDYPQDYAQPVDYGDPAIFGGNTKTDFSWAVAEKAGP